MSELIAVLVTFALIGGTVVLILGLSSWLGPKRRNPVKDTPFECGWRPVAFPGERLNIKFYLIAILFVLFDIETIFLFPWASVFRELGPVGFFSMLTFIGVLVLGLIYAWKRGALEWE
ncbi:MAG: NADH-quinone oxidoreductase subunit A [candidate division KSB1 bacterium]|nr:NADH-quinone oxidoreductase subunit A [candidate division KSB1 bacterium]MDZ7302991.1 NADH-quinone oxidoreductase subunit A [candidate division KSB1 bacterium]MDZ7312267.1 NADH-quinone oxidoreductase subunit A [candidate division KSB1 bacterium]